MIEDLIPHLQCPCSRTSLKLAGVRSFFEVNGTRHIAEGLLVSQEGDRYPIIDEIPRLVADEQKLLLEFEFLNQTHTEPAVRIEPEVYAQDQIEEIIRGRVLKNYGVNEQTAPELRFRGDAASKYQIAEYCGLNKAKYGGILEAYLAGVESILEIGGTFPAMAVDLARRSNAKRVVLANLFVNYSETFKTPSREVSIVRADVQALPFRDESFSLTASAFMLEHVPNWKLALEHMLRVGERSFVAFGPNKWFPFEVGHINAPLAGTLPKPLAARVAWLWLQVVGRSRPLHRIQEILNDVYHVSSHDFRTECARQQVECQSLFPDLIRHVAQDSKAPLTPPRKIIRTFPKLASSLARLLSSTCLEPQMYFYLTSRSSSQQSSSK